MVVFYYQDLKQNQVVWLCYLYLLFNTWCAGKAGASR